MRTGVKSRRQVNGEISKLPESETMKQKHFQIPNLEWMKFKNHIRIYNEDRERNKNKQ